MVVADVESKFEEKIRQAGLLPFFSAQESHFLDVGGDLFVEIVARDSTKLREFGRIAEEVVSGNPRIKALVRAHWNIEAVGQPVPAYDMKTGTPRTAALYPVDLKAATYPVDLKSGQGTKQIWVEVTTLASMVFKNHELDVKDIVREFVAEQLLKGGASSWNPERSPQLEINGDRAEYIASRRPRGKKQV
jgi:hypothetical protein